MSYDFGECLEISAVSAAVRNLHHKAAMRVSNLGKHEIPIDSDRAIEIRNKLKEASTLLHEIHHLLHEGHAEIFRAENPDVDIRAKVEDDILAEAEAIKSRRSLTEVS